MSSRRDIDATAPSISTSYRAVAAADHEAGTSMRQRVNRRHRAGGEQGVAERHRDRGTDLQRSC
jgi:hypothetical protein